MENCKVCAQQASLVCSCNGLYFCKDHFHQHILNDPGVHNIEHIGRKLSKRTKRRFIAEAKIRIAKIKQIEITLSKNFLLLMRKIEDNHKIMLKKLSEYKKKYYELVSKSKFSESEIEIIEYSLRTTLETKIEGKLEISRDFENFFRQKLFEEKQKTIKLDKIDFNNIPESVKKLATEADIYVQGHVGSVNSLVFTENESYIVSSGSDKTIRIWQSDLYQSYSQVSTIDNIYSEVTCISVSLDSKYFIICLDSILRLGSFSKLDLLLNLAGHSEKVTSVNFTADSKKIISTSKDKMIIIWDITDPRRYTKLQGHKFSINASVISYKNNYLVSADIRGIAIFWNLNNNIQTGLINISRSSVNVIAFDKTDKVLFVGSSDCTLTAWDIKNELQINTFEGHKSPVVNLAISKERNLLISQGNSEIFIWNSDNFQLLKLLSWNNKVNAFDFCDNKGKLMIGCHNGKIKFYDINEILTKEAFKNPVLRGYKTSKKQYVKTILSGHNKEVTSLFKVSNNEFVLSTANDGIVMAWNINSHRVEFTFTSVIEANDFIVSYPETVEIIKQWLGAKF